MKFLFTIIPGRFFFFFSNKIFPDWDVEFLRSVGQIVPAVRSILDSPRVSVVPKAIKFSHPRKM